MKNIKTILFLIIFLSIFSNESFSQIRKGSYISSLEYSVAFNTGRSSDFVSKVGLLGTTFTIKTFVAKNVAAGFSVAFNATSKEDEAGVLTELPNGAVFGPQARYIDYLPIYGSLSYFFVKDRRSKFMPYVSANIGAIESYQRLQVGVYQVDNNNWHFGLAPEIGFLSSIGNSVAISVNTRFNYALSSGQTLAGKDGNSFSFLTANIGLAYVR